MTTRWHKDLDGWVWRIYDEKGGIKGSNEDTTNAYIIPHEGVWWIVDATLTMEEKRTDWIQRVSAGEGTRVAGPFDNENDAKAAWRVIYG